MSQIDITKMSSKGQVVIPQELRRGINEGDKLVVIRNEDQIILKKADKFDKQIEANKNGLVSEGRLEQSLNSYLGVLSHADTHMLGQYLKNKFGLFR